MEVHRIPITHLSENKQDIIEMSLTSPRMYITVEGTEFDQVLGCTLYHIEIGIEEGEDYVLVTRHKLRYSEMYKFDQQLRQAHEEMSFLRKFPPKRFFLNNDSQFVAKRRVDIGVYLQNLTQIPGILNCRQFQQFFECTPQIYA
ncbi:PX domain containing protein [Tritrichomonas foetus]|uniref:PX domain containing protein n=1 Tax=Tritrichomonas foetus TaxID=1144522 RepID=A0A1J4JZW1_9EUKA|nr:PX domain containing protein [Tritrichomonas foetus]|eukprot:OHT04024.1 PX domain containing protein [Tritrichomonas foetus]